MKTRLVAATMVVIVGRAEPYSSRDEGGEGGEGGAALGLHLANFFKRIFHHLAKEGDKD